MTIDPTEFGLPADAGKLEPARTGPFWKGPCDDSESGGVTADLLKLFVLCPERTRLRYVEGLVREPRLDHKKLFARLFETALKEFRVSGTVGAGLDAAYDACEREQDRYPGGDDRDKIVHWFNVLVPTFCGYIKHRQENDIDQGATRSVQLLPDVATPVRTSYTVPSGREVTLVGPEGTSWKIGAGSTAYFRLLRRVVKGDLNPDRLLATARFDLDTMFAVVLHGGQVREVYYDMVRRPLSGGRGSISRYKPTAKNPQGESATAFYARLRDTVLDADPGYWYPHALVEIQPSDVEKFREKCLDPLLERLCDWYAVVSMIDDGRRRSGLGHYTAPFTTDAPATEYDEYLLTGSERGLTRRSKVAFPELEEGAN